MFDIEQGDIRITKENYKDYINTLFFKALQLAVKFSASLELATIIVLTPDGRLKVLVDGMDKVSYSLGQICIIDPATASKYYYPLGFSRKWNDPSVVIPDTKNGFKNSKVVKEFFAFLNNPEEYEEYEEWVDDIADKMEINAGIALNMWEKIISRRFDPVERYKSLDLDPESMLPTVTMEDLKDDPLLIK